MVVAEVVSQLEILPLKFCASQNMSCMFFTLPVFQFSNPSPSKLCAHANIPYIDVAEDTTQFDKSPLKENASINE